MRKVTWTAVGVMGLSVLLCGSGEVLAQADTTATDPTETDATDARVRGTEAGDVRVGTPGAAGTVGTPATGTTGTGGAGAAGTTGVGVGGAAGTAGTGTTAGTTGAGGATGAAGGGTAELQQSVLQLQADVARMQQELAQVRAELANMNASSGVGGSGQAGGAAPAARLQGQGTPPAQGTAPRGTTPAQDTAPRGRADQETPGSGEAVVNAIYTGTVRSVSNGRLVLQDEAGESFTVELGEGTRVLRNGRRITARQLEQGTRVRATVDLLAGHNRAIEVITLPAAR